MYQKRVVRYDKKEITITIQSLRYNKSMRALTGCCCLLSCQNALCGGSIKFIARRLCILRSGGVLSNADPMALVVATSAAQAVERSVCREARLFCPGVTLWQCAKEQLGQSMRSSMR